MRHAGKPGAGSSGDETRLIQPKSVHRNPAYFPVKFTP